MRSRPVAPLLLLGLLSAPACASLPGPAPALDPYQRALELHRQVPLVDGHNDLPHRFRELGAELAEMDPGGSLPRTHTDLPRLRAGGVGGVFWAAYVPSSTIAAGGAARHALEQIDFIHRLTEHLPELEMAYTAADVLRIHGAGRIASLIGVEGGHAIENSLGVLRQFHALGVRYLTLTHSANTDWADAATTAPRHGGLSPFGEEVVREMNRLGMLVDLSHVSDATMRHALRVSQAPVIFSHSSSRALADHGRNVPDDVLRLVSANGGVVMVNFFSGFVEPEAARIRRDMFEVRRAYEEAFPDDPEAALAAYRRWLEENPIPRGDVGTVADHVEHLLRVAGPEYVGIGADYDGVTLLPEGLEDVSTYPALTAELLRRGHSDEVLRGVLGLNVLRVMREAEEVAGRLQRERPPSAVRLEEVQPVGEQP
jgi:membrane dipeptidase